MTEFYNPVTRFNRYIVECKYEHYEDNSTEKNCFNRYIVECKFKYRKAEFFNTIVLIDT